MLVLLVVCTALRAYYSGEVTVHEVPVSSPFPQYAITCLAVCLLLSVRYLLSAIAQSEQVTNATCCNALPFNRRAQPAQEAAAAAKANPAKRE